LKLTLIEPSQKGWIILLMERYTDNDALSYLYQ